MKVVGCRGPTGVVDPRFPVRDLGAPAHTFKASKMLESIIRKQSGGIISPKRVMVKGTSDTNSFSAVIVTSTQNISLSLVE